MSALQKDDNNLNSDQLLQLIRTVAAMGEVVERLESVAESQQLTLQTLLVNQTQTQERIGTLPKHRISIDDLSRDVQEIKSDLKLFHRQASDRRNIATGVIVTSIGGIAVAIFTMVTPHLRWVGDSNPSQPSQTYSPAPRKQLSN